MGDVVAGGAGPVAAGATTGGGVAGSATTERGTTHCFFEVDLVVDFAATQALRFFTIGVVAVAGLGCLHARLVVGVGELSVSACIEQKRVRLCS